jgi:hypothetical protein
MHLVSVWGIQDNSRTTKPFLASANEPQYPQILQGFQTFSAFYLQVVCPCLCWCDNMVLELNKSLDFLTEFPEHLRQVDLVIVQLTRSIDNLWRLIDELDYMRWLPWSVPDSYPQYSGYTMMIQKALEDLQVRCTPMAKSVMMQITNMKMQKQMRMQGAAGMGVRGGAQIPLSVHAQHAQMVPGAASHYHHAAGVNMSAVQTAWAYPSGVASTMNVTNAGNYTAVSQVYAGQNMMHNNQHVVHGGTQQWHAQQFVNTGLPNHGSMEASLANQGQRMGVGDTGGDRGEEQDDYGGHEQDGQDGIAEDLGWETVNGGNKGGGGRRPQGRAGGRRRKANHDAGKPGEAQGQVQQGAAANRGVPPVGAAVVPGAGRPGGKGKRR